MSFEDEFLNFCLSCDGTLTAENEHGPYCSHACRLADREKGTPTNILATSPVLRVSDHPFSSFSSTSSLSRSFPPMSAGFHLPPAVDFSAYRRDSASESSSRPDTAPSRSFSISSTASLSSPTSPSVTTPIAAHISKEAKEELRRYEGLFDQTRHRSNRTSWA